MPDQPTASPAPHDSTVVRNARVDPTYSPYCMRCRGLQRMAIVEPLYWQCPVCSAEHDERQCLPASPAPASGGTTTKLAPGQVWVPKQTDHDGETQRVLLAFDDTFAWLGPKQPGWPTTRLRLAGLVERYRLIADVPAGASSVAVPQTEGTGTTDDSLKCIRCDALIATADWFMGGLCQTCDSGAAASPPERAGKCRRYVMVWDHAPERCGKPLPCLDHAPERAGTTTIAYSHPVAGTERAVHSADHKCVRCQRTARESGATHILNGTCAGWACFPECPAAPTPELGGANRMLTEAVDRCFTRTLGVQGAPEPGDLDKKTLAAHHEILRRAADELARLCAGRGRLTGKQLVGRDWTMSIPVQPDDSDMIFADLIEAHASLVAQGQRTAEERDAAHRIIDRYEALEDSRKDQVGPALHARASAEAENAALRDRLTHAEEDGKRLDWLDANLAGGDLLVDPPLLYVTLPANIVFNSDDSARAIIDAALCTPSAPEATT